MYEMRAFRLHKRNPLAFPKHLATSANYFNPKWSGERRLKNVMCVLEYVPDTSTVERVSSRTVVQSIQHVDFQSELLHTDATRPLVCTQSCTTLLLVC